MLLQPHKSSVVKIHEGFLGGEEAAYSVSPPAFTSKKIKKGGQNKFEGNEVKYRDSRDFLKIYMLNQYFLGLKSLFFTF